MPERFVIDGKRKLKGEVELQGSKNAAGALISAALLTTERVILENIPLVSDILNLIKLLEEIGVEISWKEEKRIEIRAREIDPQKIDLEKISKSRVSVLLIPGLLARFKKFKFARPGGDKIGLRPITTHLEALRELGVTIEREGDWYFFERDELEGKEIILPEFSVTATENLLMTATLVKGETIIKTAAEEPQVRSLILFLRKIGAEIEKIDSHIYKIKGKEKLKGCFFEVPKDPIEAGTFACIGAATAEKLLIKNFPFEYSDFFLKKLKEIGAFFKRNGNDLEVNCFSNLKAVKIQALPYPGFPTDLLPLIVPLLTKAEGKSLIHDPLYESRFNYITELRKMGADIEVVDPHRAFVFGPSSLFGVTIESWDIRAGACLILAGLIAEGKTIIKNIEQIDRGYERIEEKLQRLGAEIKREKS